MPEGRDRFAGRTGGLRGGAGMSLPVREQRALRGIEAGIWSSDPGLASWMAFFSRLTADEDNGVGGGRRGRLSRCARGARVPARCYGTGSMDGATQVAR